MVGGFLGAGKTTAILRFARWLRDERGLRVGIITNDQASGLVDTNLAKSASFATSEVAGGCFCCRSDALVHATRELTDRIRPNVFIAEPVGSCADLIATVSLPLRSIYKEDFEIAPLSVVVDPFRALRVLEGVGRVADESGGFSEDINYIYRKQLEEAEIIVINKADVLAPQRLSRLFELVASGYPDARVFIGSARTGIGLCNWFEWLLTALHRVDALLEIDYRRYARGEAQLGWFNGQYLTRSDTPLNADELLRTFAEFVRLRFAANGTEVAHLKASFEVSGSGEMAAIQWVASDRWPEITLSLADPVSAGNLTVNIRAEDDPRRITAIVDEALTNFRSMEVSKIDSRAFRPAPPEPIHRVTELPS